MKRSLLSTIADALDRATHDVFVAPQVHQHYKLSPPTVWDNCVYWCRGFAAGIAGDSDAMALSERAARWLSGVYNRASLWWRVAKA